VILLFVAGFFLPMVDLNELWIGDKLRLTISDRVGTFIGLKGNKARIQVGHKIILVSGINLEPYVEKEEVVSFFEEKENKNQVLDFHNFPTTLDLHIDKLAPHLQNELPVRILAHQLKALNQYLDYAELKSSRIFTIIHGKGTGALKSEVEHILKGRRSVKIMFETNDGGALEVHMY